MKEIYTYIYLSLISRACFRTSSFKLFKATLSASSSCFSDALTIACHPPIYKTIFIDIYCFSLFLFSTKKDLPKRKGLLSI